MNDAPLAAGLALALTRTHVNSARPDAPVVAHPGPPPARRVRGHLAAALRGLAAVLEPCEPAGTALRT